MIDANPFTLERISDPDIEPVTLSEMRIHLRCYENEASEDDEITSLMLAAREWIEDYTGRALIDQTWRLSTGRAINATTGTSNDIVAGISAGPTWQLADGGILLRRSPVLAITSFKSVDSAGVETDIDTDLYELREATSKWPRLYGLNGATWSGPLRIEYRAGYADRLGSPQQGAEMVPARYKHAMKLWCDAMFDRDEKTMELLLRVAEQIIKPERVALQLA